MLNHYMRLLKIWRTDYGRSDGWLIEEHGNPIGMLYDPVFLTQFWCSYRIRGIEGSEENARIYTEIFWYDFNFSAIKFRSIALGILAEYPIPAANPLDSEGRLAIRGLYIHARHPNLFDEVAMKIHRLFFG